MKKSNIIILTFSVIVLIATLVLFIDGKKKEDKPGLYNNNAAYKEISIPSFSVLVAADSADVHFTQTDSANIRIEHEKGTGVKGKVYDVKNDTLYIYKGYRVYAGGKEVKSIIGKNAYWIGIHTLNADSLHIDVEGGTLECLFDKGASNIGKVHLKAKNAISSWNNDFTLKELRVEGDGVNLNIFSGSLGKVDIIMNNQSSLTFSNDNRTNDIRIKKDSTCEVNMY